MTILQLVARKMFLYVVTVLRLWFRQMFFATPFVPQRSETPALKVCVSNTVPKVSMVPLPKLGRAAL